MPLRPIATKSKTGRVTNKKYSGVLERYRASDSKTTGYYLSYRDAESKSCKHAIEAKDRDDALLQLNQIKAQIKRDKLRNEVKTNKYRIYTIDELSDEFFDKKKDNANHIKEEQRYKNHIKDIVGHIKATDLLPKHVAEIQKSMKLAPKTINLATDLLRSIMRYAFANRMITRDEYTLDGYSKLQVDNQVDRIFEPQEIRSLIESIKKPRLKLFVMMAYFTAQRPESLLRLQVKDIEDGEIYIKPIKKQKGHKVKIHAELEPLLMEWIKDLDDDKFIFHGAAGQGKKAGVNKPISYERLQKETSELFEPYNTGLDYKDDRSKWVSLYTLRHSAAVQILRSTKSLKATGAVLNHSDQRVTERYARILDAEKDGAIDAL